MARWTDIDSWLKRKGIRVGAATLGQTTGGTHATNSYHYMGQARDFGLYNCDCVAIASALEPLARGRDYVIVELIWTPASGRGTYYKAGVAYTPTAKLANGHRDHVHAAITRDGVLPPISGPVPPAPVPPVPEEDFLMALSPEKQQAISDGVHNVQEWLKDPALEARIRKVVKGELDAFGLRLAAYLDTDKDGKPGPFPTD